MISVQWWVVVIVISILALLWVIIRIQRNLLERVGAEAEVSLNDARTTLAVANMQATEAEKLLDQMLLMSRVLEWQRNNDIDGFNELVVWDLAEDLSIDRAVASELYDRIVRNAGESGA